LNLVATLNEPTFCRQLAKVLQGSDIVPDVKPDDVQRQISSLACRVQSLETKADKFTDKMSEMCRRVSDVDSNAHELEEKMRQFDVALETMEATMHLHGLLQPLEDG
jgi:hypothetical protein